VKTTKKHEKLTNK